MKVSSSRQETEHLFFGPGDQYLAYRGVYGCAAFDPRTGEPLSAGEGWEKWSQLVKGDPLAHLTAHLYKKGRLRIAKRFRDPHAYLTDRRLAGRQVAHQSQIRRDCTAPDGSWIASADKDGRIIVWDARNGRFAHELTGHCAEVQGMVAAPSGRWLFSCGHDGVIRRWRVDQLPRFPHCDLAIEPLPDGNWVIWSDPDGAHRQWVNHSPGATRWLGWHAPLPDGGRWGHRPVGTYTPPAR